MSGSTDETDGVLLMREGSWELRSAQFVADDALNSYIVHECPVLDRRYSGRRYWWSRPVHGRKCDGCHGTPPDNVMTVWTLHNFDYIQGGV